MYRYIKKSLHAKILILVVGIITAGVSISIFWEIKHVERELLDEKLKASSFISQPILNAIYEDMLQERADLARRLINALSDVRGIELRLIRSNGVEEAFKDLKTIRAVEKVRGRIRPEWIADHADALDNVAQAATTPEFKKAFASYKENWSKGPVYYIEKTGPEGSPVLTYLQPIEMRPGCIACHSHEGARGILMIRTPLSEMYAHVSSARNKWLLTGVIAIALGSALLSLLIRRAVTGPIERNVSVIKDIAEGRADYSARVEVASEDEMGYFASAFNSMLDTIEMRDGENKKLFEMLAKSKEEWVSTFDAISDPIFIQDGDLRVIKANRVLAEKLKLKPEEIIGRKSAEVFYPGGSPNLALPFKDCPLPMTVSKTEADGFSFEGTFEVTTFPVLNEAGEVRASVCVARDITHEKMLREQLLHSEKLSSIGKLVAGIAHELNNPLMGIMGFSQILLDMPEDKRLGDIKDRIKKIYHESLRTAKIVQNLLTFARTRKTEREYIDLNDALKHTVDLKDYSLRSNNVRVVLELDPDLPMTMVDLYQMQQVFINIINNAEDAMTALRGRGVLEIRTRRHRGRIEITFKDDGPGIPKAVINKVFDPFFTTKEVGKGTGLGLSITHGIITEHGGDITITSVSEGGTVVTVELPIIQKEQWGEIKRVIESTAALQSPQASKVVLVVDDEKSIRDALAEILVKEGFKADTARNGADALALLEKTRYSFLITDIKMPDVNGMELYDAVLKTHPYLKGRIIIITGDIFSRDIKDFLQKTGCPYILKPFVMKELLDLIRTVLSG